MRVYKIKFLYDAKGYKQYFLEKGQVSILATDINSAMDKAKNCKRIYSQEPYKNMIITDVKTVCEVVE